MWQILEKGGWTMVPLALCSLAALAVVIERLLWGPSRSRVMPAAFLREIEELLSRRRFDELLGVCRSRTSPIARILTTAIQHRSKPRAELRQTLESAGRQEAMLLQRRLGVLGTIAVISPLLGLLGTVFGMIETFTVIQSDGIGNAAALAGGISEALITTATGLTIAIPCLVFYRFFIHQSRRLIIEMEGFAMSAAEQLSQLNLDQPAAAGPPENAGVVR